MKFTRSDTGRNGEGAGHLSRCSCNLSPYLDWYGVSFVRWSTVSGGDASGSERFHVLFRTVWIPRTEGSRSIDRTLRLEMVRMLFAIIASCVFVLFPTRGSREISSSSRNLLVVARLPTHFDFVPCIFRFLTLSSSSYAS